VQRGINTLVVAIVAVLIDAVAGAQLPSWEAVRATPLPGPAPSSVAAGPPPGAALDPGAPLPAYLPAVAAPRTTSPSSWDALREAEQELRRREEDLERCRARLQAARADLQSTQEYLRRLEAATEELRREILRRMVLLDRLGRGGVARLILTSRDPAEARFRASLVRRLVRVDAGLAERYGAMRREAEGVRADLARKLESQTALEEQLDQRRRQLADEVGRHRRLVGALGDPAVADDLRAEARVEVDGLASALDLAAPPAADAAALRDLAARSVAVPASFPVREDDLHGGLAVDLPAGLPVAAPTDGRVVFAGILGGYGPSVLIRAPSGEGVLLGHLDDLSVATGDRVAAGALVGRAGPSYSPLLPPLLVGFAGAAIAES
jgi:septal ring factor EnvC (AmiA/AmiB activator)